MARLDLKRPKTGESTTSYRNRRPIPLPSTARTKYRVAVPALIEAKIRLYEAMQAAKIGKPELRRRLGWHPPQVDRLLAMTHSSQLGQLEAAFAVLGKRLVVGVEDLPVATMQTRARSSTRAAGQSRAVRKRGATHRAIRDLTRQRKTRSR